MASPQLPELSFEQALMLHNHQLTYKGCVLGMRHALGLILEARGLVLSNEQKERVDTALGLDVRKWIRRAATATSTDELFA